MPRRRNRSKLKIWRIKEKRRTPSKPKTWRIKEKNPNWLDLPPDLTANILHRLGAIEILKNAQKVCTAWRNICKDPAMWRVIDMRNAEDFRDSDLDKLCMNAIDRSQGQLVDIKIEYFGTDELIDYMGDRSSQLRRLHVAYFFQPMSESWSELFKKLPLLEELSLVYTTGISKEAIASAGQYCPMLRSFKVNKTAWRLYSIAHTAVCFDEEAIAIGKNMTNLRHLQFLENDMTNKGLQAILDGCPHLVSLDLRQCSNIRLDGILGKRCSEQIKDLKLPEFDNDYDYEFEDDYDYNYDTMAHDYYNSDYEGLSDYDIYCGPYYNPYKDFHEVFEGMDLEDLSDSD